MKPEIFYTRFAAWPRYRPLAQYTSPTSLWGALCIYRPYLFYSLICLLNPSSSCALCTFLSAPAVSMGGVYEWRWLKKGEDGWRRMTMNDEEWRWMDTEEDEWRWMRMNEYEWRWLTIIGDERRWVNLSVHEWRWMRMHEGEWISVTISEHEMNMNEDEWRWERMNEGEHGWLKMNEAERRSMEAY